MPRDAKGDLIYPKEFYEKGSPTHGVLSVANLIEMQKRAEYDFAVKTGFY